MNNDVETSMYIYSPVLIKPHLVRFKRFDKLNGNWDREITFYYEPDSYFHETWIITNLDYTEKLRDYTLPADLYEVANDLHDEVRL